MGKIISLINTTPDGFVDSQYVNADAEFHEFVHGLLSETQVVAFGRNSFELFQQIWPAILQKPDSPEPQVRMAQALTDKPKYVYSTTLNATSWKNTTTIKAIDPDQLNRFRVHDQPGLLTIGSPGLVAGLTQVNLVDNYYFCLQSMIAGNGKTRLFDKINLPASLSLKLVDVRQLKTGVVIVHYERRPG